MQWSEQGYDRGDCGIRIEVRFRDYWTRPLRQPRSFIRSGCRKVNYVGATYQFQNLLSHPSPVSHADPERALLLHCLFCDRDCRSQFLQDRNTPTPTVGSTAAIFWSPAGGASLGWQGMYTSFVASYSHRTNEGGGLGVAVRSSTAEVSARWQMAEDLYSRVGSELRQQYRPGSVVG